MKIIKYYQQILFNSCLIIDSIIMYVKMFLKHKKINQDKEVERKD